LAIHKGQCSWGQVKIKKNPVALVGKRQGHPL
jgi:hypothetical protein